MSSLVNLNVWLPLVIAPMFAQSGLVKSPGSGCSSPFTVTLQVAVNEPAFAVMVASPAATAVTSPSATVATAGAEVDHSMVGFSVTFSGSNFTVRVSFAPIASSTAGLLREIPLRAIFSGCCSGFWQATATAAVANATSANLKNRFIC